MGGTRILFATAMGGPECFGTFQGRDHNFSCMQKGGPEKNWQPAITNRLPPIPVKNDSSVRTVKGNRLQYLDHMDKIIRYYVVGTCKTRASTIPICFPSPVETCGGPITANSVIITHGHYYLGGFITYVPGGSFHWGDQNVFAHAKGGIPNFF